MQKPKVWDKLPEFDQLTQAVVEGEYIDMGDYIRVTNKVIDLPPDESGEIV